MVQRYQTQIVRVIVTGITLVPLAQKEESARLGGYPLEPKVEKTRSRCPLGGMYSMKRSLLIFAVLIAIATAGVQPAAAQNRYIVRTTGGLGSVLNLCGLLGCQVQGSLDGNINQTFLVTSSTNIVVDLLNFTVNLVESLLGIQSIEPDKLLPVPQTKINSISSGLYDTTLVKYYGTLVTHGYAAQPAANIIRLTDAQNGFGIGGTGIVAVIDTGVDPSHPVLKPVLDRLRFHPQSVRRFRMARSFLHRHKHHHFAKCTACNGATIQRRDT